MWMFLQCIKKGSSDRDSIVSDVMVIFTFFQDGSQAFSQGPLTQGGLSQPFPMSQPGVGPLSQPELSQVSGWTSLGPV